MPPFYDAGTDSRESENATLHQKPKFFAAKALPGLRKIGVDGTELPYAVSPVSVPQKYHRLVRDPLRRCPGFALAATNLRPEHSWQREVQRELTPNVVFELGS